MTASRWRALLLPLTPIYAGVVGLKNGLLDHGLLPQRHLPHGVISIGSLSTGGAGKTPVVLMLARLLQQQGFDLRILTRGYRRNSTRTELVDPAGNAAYFGDEPMLLARHLGGASVYAGSDRHRAGLLAEREKPPTGRAVYLLDDGFQHRKLARDVDIVLLTRQELRDHLLPAGNLREPLSALKRADVIVAREDEPEVLAWLTASVPQNLIWTVRRQLRFPADAIVPRRSVVFSGIARPESFLAMLAALGVEQVATVTFRDHHSYSDRDADALLKLAQSKEADGFITTEKDAVKLSAAMLRKLEAAGPVVVPELYVELMSEQAEISELQRLLDARLSARAANHA